MNSLKKIHKYKNGKKNISIRSVKVQHGLIKSICYIINNKCAYAPDISREFPKDIKYFKNLKYLVIDCLIYKHHQLALSTTYMFYSDEDQMVETCRHKHQLPI